MSSTRKKSISQKNVERERTENRTLNRVYYVFLLGLAAECWLFLTYRIWAGSALSTGLKWFTALQVLMWLGLAALVLGAAGAYLKRQDRKVRRISVWAACVGAFFAVSGFIITFFPRASIPASPSCAPWFPSRRCWRWCTCSTSTSAP